MQKRDRYTTTAGYRNNNPTNIRYDARNKWKGQIGVRNGFCVFDSQIKAFRATTKILFRYIDRGENTPEKIIRCWAPSVENNTEAYLVYVCKKAHIERAYRISKYQRDLIVRLITAMCGFECANYEPPQSWVAAGYDLAVTEL